jgi:50S ribosomal subunit-associated GTPase HflX
MPLPDQHSNFDPLEALRRDRDRWAQMAMDQAKYIRQLEERIQVLTKAEEESVTLPQENDYQALVQWLGAEKTLGNNYYAEAGYNRSKMCRNLRKILGWEPDQNSLRKAENR